MSSNKNDSGADTWAFQSSSIDNSTSSSSRYVVSLKDAKTKEERMSIIRERMQKGTKSPIMSAKWHKFKIWDLLMYRHMLH